MGLFASYLILHQLPTNELQVFIHYIGPYGNIKTFEMIRDGRIGDSTCQVAIHKMSECR